MEKNFRYERKFRIEGLNKYEIENAIKCHPSVFSEIFYERKVNNIYFDSNDFKSYFENLSGVSNRLKMRIRWYGNLTGLIEAPVLEIKIKNNLLGKKLRFPLKSFILDENFSIKKLHNLLLKSTIPKPLQEEIKNLDFALLNSYSRKYYMSADKNYRLTIDYNMEFRKLNRERPSFLRPYKDDSIILELKYSSKHDSRVQNITNNFPFRLTKNSKYVCGVDLLTHNIMN